MRGTSRFLPKCHDKLLASTHDLKFYLGDFNQVNGNRPGLRQND